MKTTKTKLIASLTAATAAVCIAAGTGLIIAKTAKNPPMVGGYTSNTNEQPPKPIPNVTDENGNDISGGKYYAMPAKMSFTAATYADESGNEVSNAVTANLIATITPNNAANKKVDWSAAFKNPESEWASGKTLSEYIGVTPAADGSLMASVTCYQAFGEQVILTVTSRENAEATASCTIDYKQQLVSYELSVAQEEKTPSVNNTKKTGTVYADFASDTPITIHYAYNKSSPYTIELQDSEIAAPSEMKVTYKPTLLSALEKIGGSAAKTPEVTATQNGFVISDLFNKAYADRLTSAADYNQAINAIYNYGSGAVLIALNDSAGNALTNYTFTLNTKATQGQIKPESIALNNTELTFGEEMKAKTYKITYRAAGYKWATTLFEKGSECGLSKQDGGSYPESYTYGTGASVSALKSSFSCSGEKGEYHNGNGTGKVTYTFKGWYLDWDATIPFDGTIPADWVGDITLYASISSNSTHFY